MARNRSKWVEKGAKGHWKRLEAVGNIDTTGHILGTHVNSKGHLRYSAGPLRGKYVHRVIAAQLAAEWCYYPIDPAIGLPDGWDVHHLNGNPQHNCPVHNLCLMPHSLHGLLTRLEIKWRRAYLDSLGNPADNPIDRDEERVRL